MDAKLLAAILASSETALKDVEHSEEYGRLLNSETFLPYSERIPNRLCESLTKLLYHKVSREAYQRYSVRLHVIDTLRDWLRPSPSQQETCFRTSKHCSELTDSLLEKHLTERLLNNCASDESLLPLTTSVAWLCRSRSKYTEHLNRCVRRLCQVDLSEEGKEYLCFAVRDDSEVPLDLTTIDLVYERLAERLMERPLLDRFQRLHLKEADAEALEEAKPGLPRENPEEERSTVQPNHVDASETVKPGLNDSSEPPKPKSRRSVRRQREEIIEPPENNEPKDHGTDTESTVSQLTRHASRSPGVFRLVSLFLKEVFLSLDYDQRFADFVGSLMKQIRLNCHAEGRSILDLYPRQLQSTVFLLDIEPRYHSRESRLATARFLRDLLAQEDESSVVLLLHFPRWLTEIRTNDDDDPPIKKH